MKQKKEYTPKKIFLGLLQSSEVSAKKFGPKAPFVTSKKAIFMYAIK